MQDIEKYSKENKPNVYHVPVMLHETLTALVTQPNGVYIDATMGGAGHTKAILEKLGNQGKLFAFDQDLDAASNAPNDPRLTFVASNFRYIANWMDYYQIDKVDGILADLGVSSHHFDTPERGFSFRFDNAPLDMRMNNQGKLTAQAILNNYEQDALNTLLRNFGELNDSHKLATLITSARTQKPIVTAQQLIDILETMLPKQPQQRHRKLSRIFQALRIEVNDELGALSDFLEAAGNLLSPGGRLVVLSYHSLEDRLVKQWMKTQSLSTSLGNESLIYGEKPGKMKILTSKGEKPNNEEIAQNSRASSAKMRVAERRIEFVS